MKIKQFKFYCAILCNTNERKYNTNGNYTSMRRFYNFKGPL